MRRNRNSTRRAHDDAFMRKKPEYYESDEKRDARNEPHFQKIEKLKRIEARVISQGPEGKDESISNDPLTKNLQRLDKLEKSKPSHHRQSNQNRRARRFECFQCHKLGHFARECPDRIESEGGSRRQNERNQGQQKSPLNSNGPTLAAKGRSQ
ncbi:uncharacterized protein LOC128555249 [Mercenaria mercenaria]|uniref:uncharacterized protein LOC128555249 n=1 Tax=Mercenaria mercenaria TaxID=6596 RepID=UPI00234EB220|nr:uncharacterized protein LOC128555249 [Mercenaria mercenaria]